MKSRDATPCLTIGAAVGALAVAALGCTGSAPAADADDGLVNISYRGQPRVAQRRGDLLLIEGDIQVDPVDLQPMSGSDDLGGGVAVTTSALERQIGSQFKWPNGTVRYSLVNIPSDSVKADMRGAVALWQRRVPGLKFVELTSACSGDCIDFQQRTGNISSSRVGHGGGTQSLIVGTAYLVVEIAHEIAHALGAFHEQARNDRDAFVQINWANVMGCVTGATSPAQCGGPVCEAGSGTPVQNAVANGCCTADQFTSGNCYQSGNFNKAGTAGAEMFDYDYDSVMHYAAGTFSKNGSPTITALQPLPPGVVMGQLDHVSARDYDGMNALYPVLRINDVMFKNTGVQPWVQLLGRDQDVDLRFSGNFRGTSLNKPALDTTTLALGQANVSATCSSVLWTRNYRYPNSTDTGWSSSGVETFTAPDTVVTILSAGLIPVMTAIP
jgi:hypothetical protein